MASLPASPIIPLIVLDDAASAVDTVHALAAGGILAAEIALRTPDALRAIELAARDGSVAVGAGTVIHPADVDRVADAGATFVVSPGFDREVVNRCRVRGLAVLPGVATATEVQWAVRAGLKTVKFFPADRLGGLATIAALAAPFHELTFVPSGGVSAANVAEYLAHPSVAAVSGSWMAPRALLVDRDFAAVERLSREAMELVPR